MKRRARVVIRDQENKKQNALILAQRREAEKQESQPQFVKITGYSLDWKKILIGQ